jgi:hypothetical protein
VKNHKGKNNLKITERIIGTGGQQENQGWKDEKNERIKETMRVKGKPDIDIIEKKDYNGMAMLKGCQRTEYQN